MKMKKREEKKNKEMKEENKKNKWNNVYKLHGNFDIIKHLKIVLKVAIILIIQWKLD